MKKEVEKPLEQADVVRSVEQRKQKINDSVKILNPSNEKPIAKLPALTKMEQELENIKIVGVSKTTNPFRKTDREKERLREAKKKAKKSGADNRKFIKMTD